MNNGVPGLSGLATLKLQYADHMERQMFAFAGQRRLHRAAAGIEEIGLDQGRRRRFIVGEMRRMDDAVQLALLAPAQQAIGRLYGIALTLHCRGDEDA